VREDHDRAPSYQTAVGIAMICRAKNDVEGWQQANLEALRHNPDDASVRLDLGDGWWEWHGRPEEAERWYGEGIEREPEPPWAWPSLCALRYEKESDPAWRDKLEQYAAAHADNGRAVAMWDRITPYFGWLPDPVDASVNNFKQLIANVLEQQGKEPK